MDFSAPKTETDFLNDAVIRLRGKQKILEKKFPFQLKHTYWDADDLRLCMMLDKVEAMEIVRPEGLAIIITARIGWSHPEKLTLRPDHLIELFCTSPDQVKVILMAYKELGKFELGLLTAPGLDEMKEFCKLMDKEIVEVAHDLRQQKIARLFDKIYSLMLDAGPEDLVSKRMGYYRTVAQNYSMDRDAWLFEMRRLGLLR